LDRPPSHHVITASSLKTNVAVGAEAEAVARAEVAAMAVDMEVRTVVHTNRQEVPIGGTTRRRKRGSQESAKRCTRTKTRNSTESVN
jgi:hypothetical protein